MMFSDPLTLLSQGLCITMDYYNITLGLPNNFPLSDRLIAVFIFINTDLSIYISKLPDECGPCTIRNSSVAIKR